MHRREFLAATGQTLLALGTPLLSLSSSAGAEGDLPEKRPYRGPGEMKQASRDSNLITLFLCGDVMTGRGIDQVLPHPSNPQIYESYLRDAKGYVELAERENGPIPKPVDFSYIWGDVLEELARVTPDVRIINLETAVTQSNDYWLGKGINYRMHPDNIPCITAANIHCCALANNHVLDWGYTGLDETLETLTKAGMKFAGAGHNREEAEAPVVMEIANKGRVVLFSFGSVTSGIPWEWSAKEHRPGVNLLQDFSHKTVRQIGAMAQQIKQPGDILVASIHWGGNWGYRIPKAQKAFAHQLIDEAGIDIIHGHSSHHPKGIEIYQQKPIIYGCGDFLNDYEGISGYEAYRGDLALMYFVSMDTSTGRIARFEMTPTRTKRFRINLASNEEAQWMRDTLGREHEKLGTRLELEPNNRLTLRW